MVASASLTISVHPTPHASSPPPISSQSPRTTTVVGLHHREGLRCMAIPCHHHHRILSPLAFFFFSSSSACLPSVDMAMAEELTEAGSFWCRGGWCIRTFLDVIYFTCMQDIDVAALRSASRTVISSENIDVVEYEKARSRGLSRSVSITNPR